MLNRFQPVPTHAKQILGTVKLTLNGQALPLMGR